MKARSKASVTFKSRSPSDTLRLAAALAPLLKGGEVISLKGMIGAGKTFFVRGLALALGSKTSPVSASFNLMRTYKGGLKIYHFDLFRVSQEEMANIGLEEYLDLKDGVTAIEWARSAEYLYGRGDFLELDFELAGGDSRDIGVSARGVPAVRMLETLEKKWLKSMRKPAR
jgi:tRNA threonylcarbamoyladenosine biosynthesis protein TsaE